jgi:hypothetical protein
MPQIVHQKFANQQVPVQRMPSGMGRSSNALCRTALHSFQELRAGIGPGSSLLRQAGIRTLEGFCSGSPRSSFSVHEEISSVLEEIKKVSTWSDGWNGYDALAPKHEAIQYASKWIELFHREIRALALDWLEPNVTASAEGEVALEWRHGKKNLTIYIGNESAEYGKDWGMDINTEMEDGPADSPDIRLALWQWLMS